MASIHRRPDSQYWHAAWRDADGVLHLRSTKQTDRKMAMAFALEIERAEKLAGSDTLTESQARKILGDIMERAGTDEGLRSPPCDEWLKEWLASKAATKAEKTVERYLGVVDSFLQYLGNRAKRPLTALTPRDIQGFLTMRQKAGCSPKTVIVDVKIIRSALNRAKRQGLLSTNPGEAVDLPKQESVEKGTFNPAEIQMLMNTAEGEWRTLILMGFYTGARLSDCCKMAWDSVDLVAGTITYKQGKTGSTVTVPLHQDLLTHLETIASSDKREHYIMPGMASKGPGGRHGLSEGFKRIVLKAGLDLQTVQGGGIRKISKRTFHSLRHSFTSALANAGVSSEQRMKLTGHTTESVHRGYTHFEMNNLKIAIDKLPSFQ